MDMVKLGLKRGAIIVLMLASVALSVRRDTAADTVSRLADRSQWLQPEAAAASVSKRPTRRPLVPITFQWPTTIASRCVGRPMIFTGGDSSFFANLRRK
jgi:hypothetical protein